MPTYQNAEQIELTDMEDQLRSPARRETTVSPRRERTPYLRMVDTRRENDYWRQRRLEMCLLLFAVMMAILLFIFIITVTFHLIAKMY